MSKMQNDNTADSNINRNKADKTNANCTKLSNSKFLFV